jgi:lipopolysaccharide export system protein LptA
MRSTQEGPMNLFIGGGFNARCTNQDVTLRADSAEYYQNAQILYLIGNVRYTEPRVRVTSDRATYFQIDERLEGQGNVVATLPSGSVMRGPVATYERALRGIRPQSRLQAPQRPKFWLAQRDTSGRDAEPVLLTANQLVTVNDSLVYAGGKVEITRSDLDARSDSAFLDGGTEFARLMIEPVIRGKGDRSYMLKGTVVDMYSKNRIVQRVVSKGESRATSEDLLLTSDTLDMRVDQNQIQAVFAWGASRARAVSPDRDLIADSLHVRMPSQQLREVRAFRDAVATTIPDTTDIRSGEKDWVRGDTIFATFDSTRVRQRRDTTATDTATTRAARDSANRPVLAGLEARGHASARYQVPVREAPRETPGINYTRGRVIRVLMDSGTIDKVFVEDQAVGVYLEPAIDSTARPTPRGVDALTTPGQLRVPAPSGTPAPTAPGGATRPPAKPTARRDSHSIAPVAQ